MKEFDVINWKRKEVYEAFSKCDFPFYHVAFYVDVTRLKGYTSKLGLSFYYSMVYLATKAADRIESFRLRIIDGKIYDVEQSTPVLTFLKPGSEVFQSVVCRLSDTLDDFTARVKNFTELQSSFMGGEDIPTQELIYFSCLPWMEITSLSSERTLDGKSNVTAPQCPM